MGSDTPSSRRERSVSISEDRSVYPGPWYLRIWSALSWEPKRLIRHGVTTSTRRRSSVTEHTSMDSEETESERERSWWHRTVATLCYPLNKLRRVGFPSFSLGFHHILRIFIAVSWLLLSILLAGSCSYAPSTLANIYLLSISYIPSNTKSVEPSGQSANLTSIFSDAAQRAHLTVRTGYFGLCAKGEDHASWTCRKTTDDIVTAMAPHIQDPLDLLRISANFQEHAVSPGLILAAMAISVFLFSGLATFPGWHEEQKGDSDSEVEIKPFPARQVVRACFSASVFSAILLLISALWQNISAAAAASTVSYTTYGSTKAHVGPAAMVLLWLGFLALTLVSVGLLILILSMRVLSNLLEDSEDSDDSDSDEGALLRRVKVSRR